MYYIPQTHSAFYAPSPAEDMAYSTQLSFKTRNNQSYELECASIAMIGSNTTPGKRNKK